MRRFSLLLVSALCVACASPAPSEKAGSNPNDAVERSTSCAVESPAYELAYFATGCVATIDGVGVPPSAFDDWVRAIGIPHASTGSSESSGIEVVIAPIPTEQLLATFMGFYIMEHAATQEGFKAARADVDALIAFDHGSVEEFEAATRRVREEEDVDAALAWWRRKTELVLYACGPGKCEVSEDDIQAFYDQNEEELTEPPYVRVGHILFTLDEDSSEKEEESARLRAQTVAAKARAPGADFAELARAHSDGLEAQMGGDLGIFTPGQLVLPFEEAAFSMDAGDTSDPVRTPFGWHVIKVYEKGGGESAPLESIREDITRRAKAAKRAEAMEKTVRRLEGRYDMVIMPEHVARGILPVSPR